MQNHLTDFKSGDNFIAATMHLCMEYSDGCDASGFKYFGPTQNGYWGKYVALQDLPDREEQTEEQKERWKRKQEDRKLQLACRMGSYPSLVAVQQVRSNSRVSG
jgi:hypothetical protein